MNLEDEFEKVMESCGGEDLIRYLIKDDGVMNWEVCRISPIVAYSPQHMESPIIIGVAYWHNNEYKIIFSEFEFPQCPQFQEWVDYLMEMEETYENVSEAVLDHHRAIIATEMDILDAELDSWEDVIWEVINNERPNRYNEEFEHDSIFDSEYDMLDSFFEAVFGVNQFLEIVASIFEGITTNDESKDFNSDWQEEWA